MRVRLWQAAPVHVDEAAALADRLAWKPDHALDEGSARTALPERGVGRAAGDAEHHHLLTLERVGYADGATLRALLRRRRKVPYGANDNFGISTSDLILTQFGAITGGVMSTDGG